MRCGASRRNGTNFRLALYFEGTFEEFHVASPLGIQPTQNALLETISEELAVQVTSRIKLKIKPGYDVAVVEQGTVTFPQIALMVGHGNPRIAYVECSNGWMTLCS